MNLLITGAWYEAPEYIPMISKSNSVIYLQNEKDDLPCDPSWVEGIIGNGFFLYHPIEEFINLRYIQLTSAGYDRVPMDYVQKHGIKINNARGVYSIPMAEMVFAGVLQMYKDMKSFGEKQKRHSWDKQRNIREVSGKRVAIVGCGNVGTECAKRFKAFNSHVTGVDLYTREDPNYDSIKDIANLDEVLTNSDIIVITLPLTNGTKGLFDRSRLNKIKDGAILVNIARGAVIDTNALIDSLKTGRFFGILDVFETEPLDTKSELWDLENVLLTPHNSFVGEGNGKRLRDVILNSLKEYCEY